MCAVGSVISFGLRGFFPMVARRAVRRLPVFFIAAGASGSGDDELICSAVFFFFGTGVQWLNDFNSFIVHRLVRKCFLASGDEIR